MSVNPIRVTVWNEYLHERTQADVAAIYPDGIHEALAGSLRAGGLCGAHGHAGPAGARADRSCPGRNRCAALVGPPAHHEVDDAVVDRVQARVLEGMGLIPLHSAHFSKIFKRLMGTTCNLKWRVAGERERIWASPEATRSPKACRNTSSCSRRKCTASRSTSRRRTSWCS